MLKLYKSFELIKKLYFVRTGGSNEELKAANIIKDECKSLGVDAELEQFLVDYSDIEKASIRFYDPDLEFECAGVGMSGSTTLEGIIGDFIYVNSLEQALISDLENKICFVNAKLCNPKLYKEIIKKKAIGLILTTGSVYDDKENVDLDPYMYRERLYENGKIPAVCSRMKDAEELLRKMPKKAHLTLIQEEMKADSFNVVATIKGTKYPDEVICYTAHYDSVSYSKGAYDNATGSATIMQMLDYYQNNKPLRTVKFIWCGSEEMGLLGSKAYVNMHKDELENYKLCINVDMTGVTIGSDIACCSAEEGLVSFIKYLGYIEGFAIKPRMGVYSSDSTPFADSGVPALSFARISPTGGAVIHSRKDVMDYLSEDNYYKTCDFIKSFSDKMINSAYVPVSRVIPDKIKQDLDIYLGRKEKNE